MQIINKALPQTGGWVGGLLVTMYRDHTSSPATAVFRISMASVRSRHVLTMLNLIPDTKHALTIKNLQEDHTN